MTMSQPRLIRGLRFLRWCVLINVIHALAVILFVEILPRWPGGNVATRSREVFAIGDPVLELAMWLLALVGLCHCARATRAGDLQISYQVALPLMVAFAVWAAMGVFHSSFGGLQHVYAFLASGPGSVVPYVAAALHLTLLAAMTQLALGLNSRTQRRLTGTMVVLAISLILLLGYLAEICFHVLFDLASSGRVNVTNGWYAALSLALSASWYVPVFAFAWTWIVLGRARQRLITIGICLTCGYDLTGNKSGSCPECGEGTKSGQEPD